MVVFDTSFLNLAFDKSWNAPIDPLTKLPIEKLQEKIDFLIKSLDKSRQRILVPTPVLAEYLVRGGADSDKRLVILSSSKVYQVVPFDVRAAVECAQIEDGDSRSGKAISGNESKAKVKFDRQIIAIAKSRGAKAIYTGDKTLGSRARENGLHVVFTWELPLPAEDSQLQLPHVNK